MFTVVETPTFSKLAADYWSEDERGEFAAWIAVNPDAGDVVPSSGGQPFKGALHYAFLRASTLAVAT